MPRTDDWKISEILESLSEDGPTRGRVGVWNLAIMGEVTHALQASQTLEKEAYDHGLGPGYFRVRWKWKESVGPEYVLVPSRHWGTSGARPIYEANLRRWEEIRPAYRERARFDLPRNLSLTLYVRRDR